MKKKNICKEKQVFFHIQLSAFHYNIGRKQSSNTQNTSGIPLFFSVEDNVCLCKFRGEEIFEFHESCCKNGKILLLTSVTRKTTTSFMDIPCFFLPADMTCLWRQHKIFLFFAFLLSYVRNVVCWCNTR